MKKAVIDIGTNSVKLTLGEPAADGGARMICDMNVITKLGEGMRASGALSAEAMERTAQAVAKFAAFARAEDADEILCVGTMALRRAANAADFSSRVRGLCGLGVTVLPGEAETFGSARFGMLAGFAQQYLFYGIREYGVDFFLRRNAGVC